MALPPALTKMVGPLPVGAWVAAVGGALGLAQLAKRRKAVESPAVLSNGSVPYPVTAMPMGSPSLGGAVSLGAILDSPPAQTTIQSNTDWQRVATLQLTGRGFGAYGVQQALAKYLQGLDALTAEQANIVESALRLVGPPPHPPTVAPPPRPRPAAASRRSSPSAGPGPSTPRPRRSPVRTSGSATAASPSTRRTRSSASTGAG